MGDVMNDWREEQGKGGYRGRKSRTNLCLE